MAEKVTDMVLKVDLQCPCCYKKVKKILCKFPEIRDQKFDEKGNKVTITVVCCNPEKLRDKLCCKGAKVIKSIEIVEPPKIELPEKTKESGNSKVVTKEESEKDKPPESKKDKPPESEKAKPPELVMYPCPFLMYPLCYSVPVRTCCGPCSERYCGGPCYFGYGYGRACHVTRCDHYFT